MYCFQDFIILHGLHKYPNVNKCLFSNQNKIFMKEIIKVIATKLKSTLNTFIAFEISFILISVNMNYH